MELLGVEIRKPGEVTFSWHKITKLQKHFCVYFSHKIRKIKNGKEQTGQYIED